MLDGTALKAMSQIAIEEIDRNELVNMEEVKIDVSLPAPQRMLKYLEDIKNPYCFLCGKTPVKIRFSQDGKELAELLKEHFIALKR